MSGIDGTGACWSSLGLVVGRRVKREVTPREGGHMDSLDVVESVEQVEQCDLLLVMIVCEPQTS